MAKIQFDRVVDGSVKPLDPCECMFSKGAPGTVCAYCSRAILSQKERRTLEDVKGHINRPESFK